MITVIIPVYNVENYLEECLNSIIGQTYKNLEIILIDDGSTDSSGIICDRYAEKDARINVIHKRNGGLSSARNAGLDAACGDFIFFVDSDDSIKENTLETLYDLQQRHEADIAYCSFYDKVSRKESIPLIREEVFSKDVFFQNIQKTYDIDFVIVWNKLYKKALFYNIRFPEGKINEDVATSYKLYFSAEKIVHTNQRLYYYRTRENSIINSKFSKKFYDAIEANLDRIEFFKEKEMPDTACFFECAYLTLLFQDYYKTKKYLKDKDVLTDLKDKILIIAPEIYNNKKAPGKLKLLLNIFRFSKFIFYYFYKIFVNSGVWGKIKNIISAKR